MMARWDTVGSIFQTSDDGSGDKYGPEFIRCVDERDPQIREAWTFGEDSVTFQVHPTA